MSEEICYFNYQYQGQVYSPAFSDPPPSPTSTESDRSPSSSTSGSASGSNCDEAWSVAEAAALREEGGDRDEDHFHAFGPKRRTRTPPSPESSEPAAAAAATVARPLPRKTHRSDVDDHLQERFLKLLGAKPPQTAGCESFRKISGASAVSGMEEFLVRHSDRIDIDRYDQDGRTPLQRCCLFGDLPMAKLLVRFGANSLLTTKEGFSTLHIAAFAGNADVLGFVMSLKSSG